MNEQKKKPGRKMKTLGEEHVEQIIQLGAQGLGIMQICQALDISWDVFNRERGKKEISDALKKGQALGIKAVTNSLFNQATNGKNTVASIFYLKNRDPDNWADKQETEVNINLREILDNASTRISEQQVNTIDITPEKPLDIGNDKEILIPSKNDSEIIQDPEERSSRSRDLKDD
tara:strand:- start:208 stop:732 length:525 start_codon:yes stop_codon:yes gene_type:complete